MIPEYQRQLDQLSKNMMLIATKERERIAQDLKRIDRANNFAGNGKPAKQALAPLTLHDKAQNNPVLRKMLRDLQRTL